MRRRAGLIIATALCLGASNGDGQHAQRRGSAQTEQAKAEVANATLAGADQAGAHGGADPGPKSDNPKDWFGLTPEALTGRSTFALAVLTALLGGGTVALALYTRRLVLDGAKNLHAARVSARIAHRALAHARESAQSVRDSEERLERAYVFPGIGNVHFTPYGYRVMVGVNNFGKTPAFIKNLTGHYFTYEPTAPTGSFRSIHYPLDFVWAAGEKEILMSCPFDSTTPITFIGFTISYKDIFGRDHFSRFIVGFDGKTEWTRMCPTNIYWNEWD